MKKSFLTALFFYLICAVIFFAPVSGNLATSLIGPAEDNMQTLWNIWWVNQPVLVNQEYLFFTKFLFFPEGTSLYFHTLSPYNLALSVILVKFVGIVFTYNILLITAFILSGISAYYLIRYLVGGKFIALLGGFIYAFNPYNFAQAQHHLNIVSIQFVPVFILFLVKSLRLKRKSDIFWAVVFMVLSALCSWHYFVYLLYFMFFYYIYLSIKNSKLFLYSEAKVCFFIFSFSVFILLPLLVPLIKNGINYSIKLDWYYHSNMVADLFGFFTPPSQHLLGEFAFIKSISFKFTGNDWIKVVYLGLINISILFLMFKYLFRIAKPYIFGMIVFMILAMGEYIHILGYSLTIPLPGFFLKYIPLVSSVRCPARFMVFVYLFLGILVTLALKEIGVKCSKGHFKKIVFSLLLVLVFIDYYSYSSAVTRVELPRGYDVIEEDSDRGFGILDLPGYPDKDWWVNCDRYMMYQTLHGRPIVQGAVSRRLGDALIDRLERENLDLQKKQLRLAGVKYIIIHKDLIDPAMGFNLVDYRKFYRVIIENNEIVSLQVY